MLLLLCGSSISPLLNRNKPKYIYAWQNDHNHLTPCSQLGFYCYDEHYEQKQVGEERVYFILYFVVYYTEMPG